MERERLKEIRWKQRFENYLSALEHLQNGVERQELDDLQRAGVIQFFEMSFELAWKVMKDYLESEGILVRSPREAIKEAYRIGLIDRGELWLSALQERNLAAHTYDERILEEFTEEIRHEFFPLMITLKDNLERSL